MRLFFLRHGLADRAAWDGSDFERPLTPRGERRMEAEARVMARLGLDLDLVLSSPLVRARQTAEIAARHLAPAGGVGIDERLGFGFGPSAVAGILRDHAGCANLMLVGHEPGFSLVLRAMTGGDVVCKKGSLARVDVYDHEAPSGELVWLIPPKALADVL